MALPLSEEEIQEAITYGKSRAQLTANELLQDWTVDLGYEQGRGRAVLITPFARVALLAWQAAKTGGDLNRQLVEIALREQARFFHFRVSLYGDEPGFCRKARFTLNWNGKKIEPTSGYVPAYGDFTRDYYVVATGDIKFPRTSIPSDAEVRLEVTIPATKETKANIIVFPFPLAAYR